MGIRKFRPKGEIMSKVIEGSFPAGIKPRIAESRPRREEIELRAYQIYVERGGALGQDLEDWLQAENELLEKYGKGGQLSKARAV
jgi:hypothetical protein